MMMRLFRLLFSASVWHPIDHYPLFALGAGIQPLDGTTSWWRRGVLTALILMLPSREWVWNWWRTQTCSSATTNSVCRCVR
jgi:hypothetical protein